MKQILIYQQEIVLSLINDIILKDKEKWMNTVEEALVKYYDASKYLKSHKIVKY